VYNNDTDKLMSLIFKKISKLPACILQRPRALKGHTLTTTDDRGHLRPEFRRSKTDAWGTFIGTWDLPKRLPGILHTVLHHYSFSKHCLYHTVQGAAKSNPWVFVIFRETARNVHAKYQHLCFYLLNNGEWNCIIFRNGIITDILA